MQINWAGQDFLLLKEKAIFQISTATLFVSDLHLGKTAFFRRNGIALPVESTSHNVARLDYLMKNLPVGRIVFCGDMIHETLSNETDQFINWRNLYSGIEMHNVLGNHDIRSTDFYSRAGIQLHPEPLQSGSFQISHEPIDNAVLPVICGHIHPVVRLNSGRAQSFRLPCFVVENERIVLPSFGFFTGGYEIELKNSSSVYVVTPQEVIDVSVMIGRE